MPQVDPHSLKNKSTYSFCKEYFSTTMRFTGEIFVFVLVIVTSYASLQKGSLRIQFQPPPYACVESNSSLKDYYSGEIASPFETILDSDVSLILYYAPWDSDSKFAILEFEKVANKYSNNQVFFASINCWVHTGACRKTFPKLRNFPLMLGYVGKSKGVHFRGSFQYDFMEKFVQSLLKPLYRIESVGDLFNLMTESTAVVTGYFDFQLPKPAGFYSFYATSIRNIELDPHNSIKFAIITNPLAAKRFGINISSLSKSSPFDIRLHLWNETLIYPTAASTVDVGRLLHWVHYRKHSPIQWVWLSGRKNQIIQNYFIEPQKIFVVLFTSSRKSSAKALMLKEVALNFNNCGLSPRLTRLIQEIQSKRSALASSSLAKERKCCLLEMDQNHTKALSTRSLSFDFNKEMYSCSSDQHHYNYESVQSTNDFQGLSCRTNRSLSFLLIDTTQYSNLLGSLGYTVKHRIQNPNAAFIIDPKAESTYIMNQQITVRNLEQFIVNYTVFRLDRFLRDKRLSKTCFPGRKCVQEISSSNFEKVILNPSYDAVVFYRKSGCVFCEVASRAFLKLSQMFEDTASGLLSKLSHDMRQVRFYTVDAEKNDLPWHFTATRYPSIIFYAADRKDDSRIFPDNLELNTMNLLNFVVSQLSLYNRILWFIRLCQNVSCLQEAQHQIGRQLVIVEKKIRSLRQRVLRSDVSDLRLVSRLHNSLKERHFFHELSHNVRKTIQKLLLRTNQTYLNGIEIVSNS